MRALEAALVAAGIAGLAAAPAFGGTITSATGPLTVNGQTVTVDPSSPLELAPGARLETGASRATFRSAAGDEIQLEQQTVVRAEGIDEGIDHLFLLWGSGLARLSDKTSFGSAAAWATAPAGQSAQVRVEAPQDLATSESYFRAIEGTPWLRYRSFAVLLVQGNSVTLQIDPGLDGTLCFRTSQQNPGEVEVRRTVAGGEIRAFVPRASSGCLEDAPGNKTKITNDIASLKTAKIRIETHFRARPPQAAEVGPGTYALIDNATGTIQVVFTAVEFEILERAISLTTEFSTLAQSNFSDVE